MKVFDTVRERLAQLPKGPITWIVFLPALVWFSITALRDEVYGGRNSRWYNYIFGEPFIFGIAYAATILLTGAQPWHNSGWAFAHSLFTWCLFEFWLAPLIYLWSLKPLAIFVVDKAWPRIDKLTKDHCGPFVRGTVNAITKVTPGSRWIWSHVKQDSFVIVGLQLLGGLTAVAITLYSGWWTKGWLIDLAAAHHLLAAAPTTIIGTVVNICAYFVAYAFVALVGGFIIASFEYARQQGIGLALSLAGAWGCHGLTERLAAASGYAPWLGWAATALAAVLFTAYVFPTVVAIFSAGFLAKVWREVIRPCQTEFFEGSETGFRQIVSQVANLVGTGFVVHYTLVEGAAIGLSLAVTLPTAAFLAFLSLSALGEWLDEREGNGLIALVLALVAAAHVNQIWLAHGFVFGHWGGIGAGVLTALLVGRIFIPLVFVGLARALAGGPRRKKAADFLGGKMKAAHKWLVDNYAKPFMEWCEGVYEDGYVKTTANQQLKNFRLVVLHLANIVVAIGLGGATCWGTHSLLAAFPDLALFGLSLHWPIAVLGYGLATLVSFLSYSLIGHALLEAGFEIAGFISGLAAGVWTSVALHSVQPQGWFFAAPIGLVVMGIVFGLVVPGLIHLVQSEGAKIPAGILTPFAALQDRAWQRTAKLWDRFVTVRKWLDDVFGPIFKALHELLDAFRGNKKKQ